MDIALMESGAFMAKYGTPIIQNALKAEGAAILLGISSCNAIL
jgi:hypothetical protein